MGIRSLGRNDAPVLTVAVYFFIQEPKSLMFLSFILKEIVRWFKGRESAYRLACGLFLTSIDTTWLRTSFFANKNFLV